MLFALPCAPLRSHLLSCLGLLLALSAALPGVAHAAATYYVATSGSDGNPGTEASPFLTIQTAINASVSGDTVAVTPGTYTGPGDVDLDFGGRSITVEGTGGASQTVINCQGSSANNHRGFSFGSGETSAAVVQGFTIENGYVSDYGAGIEIASAGPTITQCIFAGDTAADGGGIAVVFGATATVTRCVFTGNSVAGVGSGLICYQSGLTCTDSVFAGNSGSALAVYATSTATITNCSLTANTNGYALDFGNPNDSTSVTLTNVVSYGNSVDLLAFPSPTRVSLSHSDTGFIVNEGGLVDDGGNINADPLFVSGTAPYDLELRHGSPAIGAGTSAAPDFPASDFNGRAWQSPPSMGAYENDTFYVSPGGSDGNPGTEASPFLTIQTAINASVSGDTVAVTPGTYTGPGDVDLDFGGRSITVEGTGGASQTVINCQGSSANNHRGFSFGSGETGAAVVQGFTIENGYVSGSAGGGGVNIGGASPTLLDDIFQGDAAGQGGGVADAGGSPTIVNCVFVGNSATIYGSAYYGQYNGTPTLTDCTFTGNNAGTATVLNLFGSGTITLTNCLFYADTNNPYGDFYVQGAEALSHCLFGTDPLFVTPFNSATGAYDLHVQPGSPAVGAGVAVAGLTTDITGATRADPPTIGAYEGAAAKTSTGVTLSLNPSAVGKIVTAAVTVANTSASTGPVPTGTVTVDFGDGSYSTGVPLSNGHAAPSHAYGVPGVYTVKATYAPSGGNFLTSFNSLTQTVYAYPMANSQNVSVAFNTANGITLTGSDSNTPPQSLAYAIGTGPAHGTLSGTAPNVTYTPNTGYHGADSFTFTVTNTANLTSTAATVSLTVATGTPTANAQNVSVGFNTAKGITLTGSDPDVPALPLAYAIGTGPAHGTLSGTAPNLTYTPNTGYHGADSFTFTVSNGTKTSSPATVSLTVAAGTPTANAQNVTTKEGTAVPITLTGSDPDVPALSLTYAIGIGPAHGTLTGTAPNVAYTPSANYFGPDSFTFTVSNGTNTSTAATVSITVSRVLATVTGLSATWGSQTAPLGLGSNLLPGGRSTDVPWQGVKAFSFALSSPETLAPGDVTVTGKAHGSYGPVTVSGSGTSYTVTLATPISVADRVTLSIGNAGITAFTGTLPVLPGDLNDDGAVNASDTVLARNAITAPYSVYADINGDGVVNVTDYNLVRTFIGTTLP